MRNLLSTVLLIAAATLIGVAGYLYYQDRQESGDLPPPPNIAGQAELINVYDALDAEGVDVEYGRSSARIDGISTVGQELVVDGESLFVFLFSDPISREEEMSAISVEDIELTDSFGEPLEVESIQVFTSSNVLAVLAGGSEDLAEQVNVSIQSIL